MFAGFFFGGFFFGGGGVLLIRALPRYPLKVTRVTSWKTT